MIPSFADLHALSVGGVTHDRYGDDVRAGGSAYYAARTWTALGAQARLITSVGEDFSCEAELAGLSLVRSQAGRTLTFLNQPTRLVAGDAPLVSPSLLPPAWRENQVVLLAPVFGEVDVEGWLDALLAPWVGLVLQGLVRLPGERDDGLPDGRRVVPCPPRLPDSAWQRLSLVVLSDEDLAGLGEARAAAVVETLRASVPVVVVTRGAAGSVVITEHTTWDVGVADAEVADSTGAGDAFAASMLLGLGAGMSAQNAACFASAAASVVVEGTAGDAIKHLRDQVEWRMKSVSVCAR